MKKYADQFVGKICLVTGAAMGIGKEIAIEMGVNCGAEVFCADINLSGAESTAAQINENGGKAAAIQCDVSCEAKVRALIERIIETSGRLDYVSSNVAATSPAMTAPDTTLETMDSEWLHKTFDINFFGTFYLFKYAIPEMLKQGRGSCVVMSSVAAKFGGDFQTMYGATKAALEKMVRGCAAMYGKRGLRFNAVEPSATLTPAYLSTYPEETRDIMKCGIFNPEFSKGDKIATVVSFLLSDEAYTITGSTICADNGYHVMSGMSGASTYAGFLAGKIDGNWTDAQGQGVYDGFEAGK